MHTDFQHHKLAFSQATGTYDQASAIQLDVFHWLLGFVKQTSFDSVLDIGSATGRGTARLQERFQANHCRGIDVSTEMVAFANKHFDQCEFACLSVDALTCEDRADLVFSNATLHWAPHLTKSFKVLGSFVEQGSTLAVSLFLPATFKELAQGLREVVDASLQLPAESFCGANELDKLAGQYFVDHQLHRYTRKVVFESVLALLQHIKQTGTVTRPRRIELKPGHIKALQSWFEDNYGQVEVTVDVWGAVVVTP